MASPEEGPAFSSVQSEIGDRFGVLPNFFRLAPEAPEVTENLWGFARFGYLDNPLPALFKERLFVYLSRFCDVRYCLARHVGFLTGLGKPAGDEQCAPETVEQVVRMLRRPLPRGAEVEAHLALLESRHAEPLDLEELDEELDVAVFACAANVFLESAHAGSCLEALRRALGEVPFQHLLVFLTFVRTAHFWTKVHPELHLEDDIKDLLGIHEALAECVMNDPEAMGSEVSQGLLDELAMLRRERDQAELLRVTLASIGDAVVTTDTVGAITDLNAVAEELTGWTKEEAVGQALATVFRVVDEKGRLPGGGGLDGSHGGAELGLTRHTILTAKDGTTRPIEDTVAPIRSGKGDEVGSVLVFREVTERHREESLLVDQNRVLEQVARGGDLAKILDEVCLAGERHIGGGSIAAMLVAEEGGTRLRHVAGGRCPARYLEAIDPVEVGPTIGSCGTAAFRGERVVVEDIATDPLWEGFRELALSHGLAACWSVPILSPAGTVRGTFAVYSPNPRRPSEQEMQAIEFLAHTAGIAIERQRSEQAVRDSDLRYRLVGEAANDAIWDWDLVTNGVTWNEGVRTQFGHTSDQVDSDASWWVKNIHPDDRERVTHGIHAVIDGDGERWNSEYRFQRADGTYAVVFDRGRVVRDDSGKPVRMVGSMLDLTERKRAERERADAQRMFYDLVEKCPFGIYIVDSDFRIASMNEGSQTGAFANVSPAIGCPYDEALRVLWPEPVAAELMRIFRHTLETGESYFSNRFENQRADIGETESYEWELHRVMLPGGRFGVVCYYFDSTELRRTERELRFQLDLTKGITDTATTAIFMMDDKSRCTFMNPAAEAMTGFQFEEVQGEILHDFIHHHHPDGRPYPMPECPIDRALPENGEVRDHEDIFIRKNGEYFPVMINALVIRKQGVAVGTVIEVQDITVRKRAEEALRESEERFRTIFTQTLAGIAEVDLTGRFVQVNARYCEVVGRTEDELYGLRMHDITHPDDLVRNLPLFEAAVAGGDPFVIEKRYIRPDGSLVWVSNSVSVIRDRDGKPRHVVAATIDITERKESEAQLAEALRFYHSSIDALTSHLAVLDEQGVILEVNHAWRDFAEMNDFVGQKWGVGLNYVELCETSTGECADDGKIARGIRDVLSGRAELYECEYPCHSPTEQRWFLMRVTRFQSMGAVRVVVTHDNVTQRRAAEERLRKLAAKLSEANHRKNEFLATLAHELRNPLAPIRNGLQLIGMSNGDSEAVERTCGMIDRQLSQMVRLVDDLMDVSRISTGKLELRKEQVTLSSVVGSAVETSRPLIDQMGHELSVKLPEQPLELLVDPTRLSQVFLNLLNNAAKYSDRNGKIQLTAERQGDEVVVTVKDRGIGLPADKLSHVFEMFSQVDPSLERAQGGLGIGLSLVKRLVELHDGSIKAHSEGLGKGAEFVVRLPVVSKAPADKADEGAPERKSSKLRILVVDDNRDGADSLAMMLGMMGNETQTAYDGEEAVAAAEKFRPQVILLDIGLPKLNGHEACRRIREMEGGDAIVIIAQTGWGQEEDRERTSEAGFDHHLVKPLDPKKLLGLLKSISEEREPG
ncbi:PAS domain S-box protein [Haloferula chungangensis]|uniref:histidine kinase n=1 Tax=Haloferula chungangensis TaxID=1048331 RepID=A0ABW2L1W0_9BACT